MARYADGLSQPVSRSRRWRMPSTGILRDLAIPGLHVAVLWAFAVTQPMLDLLGNAPEFFVARENSRADILILAFALTIVPPLLLMAVELVATLISRGLGRIVHLVFVGGLVAAFVLQILKDHPGGSSGLLIPLSAGHRGGRGRVVRPHEGLPDAAHRARAGTRSCSSSSSCSSRRRRSSCFRARRSRRRT